MLVPYLEGFGRPLLPLATKSLEMYDAFVDRVSRDAGIGVGYRRTGSLQVVTADQALDELQHIAADARAAGLECELLDERARARGGTAADARSVRRAAHEIARVCRHRGFVRRAGRGCHQARRSGACACARAAHRAPGRRHQRPSRQRRGRHRRITLSSRPEAGRGRLILTGIPPLPVRPIRGQLLQLASDGPALRSHRVGTAMLSRAGEPRFDSRRRHRRRRRIRRAHDRRRRARSARQRVRPGSASVAGDVRRRARGTAAGDVDEMPIIGRSAKMPGLVYATGHYRNGVLLAPLTARAVADLVLDNRDDPLLAAAAPQRFGEY